MYSTTDHKESKKITKRCGKYHVFIKAHGKIPIILHHQYTRKRKINKRPPKREGKLYKMIYNT